MATDDLHEITESRTVAASATTVFDFLVIPANHRRLDSLDMLRDCDAPPLAAVGEAFVFQMHNDEMGAYEITNHVVVFDRDRALAWEPVLTNATRDEDRADVGTPVGHRWGYRLEPTSDSSTVVTSTFDCSNAQEWLVTVLDGGERWRTPMQKSLAALDRLITS
jgi:hypothetical protein